jgi:hypothetical protein
LPYAQVNGILRTIHKIRPGWKSRTNSNGRAARATGTQEAHTRQPMPQAGEDNDFDSPFQAI